MKCQIVSIGNELLIGDTLNTNASWIGRVLSEYGVEVKRVHTIGDDPDLIKTVIKESMAEANLVVTTGGLGPTHDDLTKITVAELFDVSLILHKPTLSHIKNIFKKRALTFSKSNYDQARIPANAEVLFNKWGTAPGLWIQEGDSCLAVLPGVPTEMKQLVKKKLVPKINDFSKRKKRQYSRYILTAGVGESNLSDLLIGDPDNFLNDKVSVAYLPGVEGNRLRISSEAETAEEATKEIDKVVDHIYKNAGEVVAGEGREITLAQALGNILLEKQQTLATAESCTGGLLSDKITNVPGSSNYMLGGIIAYANSAKINLLNVSEKTLDRFGAVSKLVALQMAKGAAERFGSDIGISTTGIAGPGGGTNEKPVGTVWIGYWSSGRHFALKALFTNGRLLNKKQSTAVAMEMVRRTLNNIETMPYGLNPHFA